MMEADAGILLSLGCTRLKGERPASALILGKNYLMFAVIKKQQNNKYVRWMMPTVVMYRAAKEAPDHHFCGGLRTAARAALGSGCPGLQESQASSTRKAKETSGGVRAL